jgi:hypothetical protein
LLAVAQVEIPLLAEAVLEDLELVVLFLYHLERQLQ